MRFLVLIALGGLMDAARSFAPHPGSGSGAAGTALAFGYLLLSAYFVGDLFYRIAMPRLTGYIITGVVVGPNLMNLVSTQMVGNLRMFNGIAIALIALTAGVELNLKEVRPLFKSIQWLIVTAIFGSILVLSATVYFARGFMPFLNGMTQPQLIAVAGVLGVTLVAQSPAVVIALRSEMDADGPLMRTVLGVVMMSDLAIVILFGIVSSIAKAFLGAGTDALQTALALAWSIIGSILIGAIAGVVIALYFRFVKAAGALFIIVLGFVVAEVGQRVDLDPLIIMLASGLLIRNATKQGDRLLEAIESASMPIYLVFFGVAGATLHLLDLATVWPAALILVFARATAFGAGSWAGTAIARAPEAVKKYVALGLLPQAGLALALALLIAKTFPSFGPQASSLILSVVAINQLIAPILFRYALVRSGETNASEQLASPGPVTAVQPG